MTPVKYITNRDLLAEIHASKTTFCTFDKPEYSRFDAILQSTDEITPEVIEQTRAARAKKLSTKLAPVTADSIDPDSLIYRVTNWSHIPVDPTGKRRPRIVGEEGQLRTNFPPFIHVIMRDGAPVEVGRSHWTNKIPGGGFSIEHGRITNRLATMFMLLVDRYSRRGNWRGYCVDEKTEAYTQRGWLKHEQINTSDMIASYNNGSLVWSAVDEVYSSEYDDNMFHLTGTGIDALVTPGHKFMTQSGLKRVELLLDTDRITLSGYVASEFQGTEMATTFANQHRNGSHINIPHVNFHGGKMSDSGSHKLDSPNLPTVPYKGIVWCPKTQFGCFMARRNGAVYLTGNTYVDEMRSHALLHLSQTGLQFDEAKSDNPFAFYTTVIRHCFTRVLNLERRAQSIRDDLLIMAGVNPSFNRQIDHEMAERESEAQASSKTGTASLEVPVPVPAKKPRGRKPKVVADAMNPFRTHQTRD